MKERKRREREGKSDRGGEKSRERRETEGGRK